MIKQMKQHLKANSGGRLEHLCRDDKNDQMLSTETSAGLQFLEAWFSGEAYENHRHDTYAIGITDSGVQCYEYRGATQSSTPGSVMVLHPDELHNGRAGSSEGFGYRMLYVEPALIAEAVRQITGRYCALPHVKESVSQNPILANAVLLASHGSFGHGESLAFDQTILLLAEGLIAADKSCVNPNRQLLIEVGAVETAREYLRSHDDRVVHSKELERITGLSRYDLSRQFRKLLGTSPYRYSVYRRLEKARKLIPNTPLSEIALQCGFADQAHFSRHFKSTFGITAGRYALLNSISR